MYIYKYIYKLKLLFHRIIKYLLNSVFGGFGRAQNAGCVNNLGFLFFTWICAFSAAVNTTSGFEIL